MNLDDIHLIKDSRFNVVYHIPSSTLKIVNDSAYKVLSLLKEGQSMEIFGDKKKDVRVFLDSFFDSLAQNNDDALDIGKEYNKQISRITVHVSNDCNLRCRYCYAQGGHYGQDKQNEGTE